MGTNLCNEPGKKSVRMNDQDVKRAEELGLENTSASTVFSELLERAVLLKEIQKMKKNDIRELQNKIDRIREDYELRD